MAQFGIDNIEETRALEEKQLSAEEIFNGRILHVFKDKVVLPDGSESVREYITHFGAVAILPVTDDGYVYMERQFRYPLHKVITEVPAGKLNSREENRLEAAKRELREETGLTADEWTDVGEYHPSAAYCDEKLTLYIARGLHAGETELDEDEFLNVAKVPFEDMLNDVMSGRITDGKTQVLILKAALLMKQGKKEDKK